MGFWAIGNAFAQDLPKVNVEQISILDDYNNKRHDFLIKKNIAKEIYINKKLKENKLKREGNEILKRNRQLRKYYGIPEASDKPIEMTREAMVLLSNGKMAPTLIKE